MRVKVTIEYVDRYNQFFKGESEIDNLDIDSRGNIKCQYMKLLLL